MADLNYIVKRFGREQEPVVIIDSFSSDLGLLRANAATQSYQKLGPFYPGVRAQANPSYLGERMELLTEILKTVFDFQKGVKLTECAYSLVTTKPHDLIPIQCLPHYDGVERNRLAVLHYLSGPETGGTAFYRHNATGYETITEARFETYRSSLTDEAERFGLPSQQYFRGTNNQFEEIGRVEAKANRLAIYRGITLHSGFIPEDMLFSQDPEEGRLTINTFLSAK